MIRAFKKNKILILISLLSAVLYFVFAYHLVRTNFGMLIALYGALFFGFYFIVRNNKDNTSWLTGAGIILRLVFLLAIPNLSQDFYRFIWDGELLLKGVNPYLYRPDILISDPGFYLPDMQALYEGMGSLNASHYSNYPPLNQLLFAIASVFSNEITGVVIAMRLLLILADIGVLYIGKKLLKYLNLPGYYIFWYFLNPFIIIELTGNLHFEGVMLFFVLWSVYVLLRNKIVLSGILLAAAVSIKLIPLLFLPLFLKRLGWKKMMVFGAVTVLGAVALFLPFLSEAFLANYRETIGLWFNNFEFNGSWYVLVREMGFGGKSYLSIKPYGKIMPLVVIIFVALIALFRKNKTPVQLITAMLLALSFYYFTATTVHPWYITMLIGLSIFTKYRFPLVWSFVIILSYYTYSSVPFRENLWLISLEYILVYGVLFREIFYKKPAFRGI